MNLLNASKVLEKLFNTFHGDYMNKEPGIIKKLKIMVQKNIPDNSIPDEVLACMIRTLTYIRIRELNRANQQKPIKQNYQNSKIKKILM